MSPEEIALFNKLARDAGLMPSLLGGPEDVQAALNSQRPKVRLPGDDRELGQFSREVGEIMAKRDLFRRDLTTVVVNPEKQRLDVVTPDMARTWVETHLVCFKEKILGSGTSARVIEIAKTMNVDTAKGMLAARQFTTQLPELERLNQTRLPVMRKDGVIDLLKPGHFPEGRIFTLDDELVYDEEMTPAEARVVIDELLAEFPFKDERSKAAQLAGMLTMFGAGLLPRKAMRPGFVVTANSTGAGKTLLCKLAIIPVARSAAPRSFPRKEELKKVLDVAAMDGVNYILFDNIRGQLGGEEIESFLTANEWEGRVLGESRKFRVENVATCFFTGNESRPTQDMRERCLFVELFVQEADSRDRTIKRVIDDAYLGSVEVRGRVLSALWAMVKAWDAAGRPGALTRMPRYELWSNVIAGIVAHAGFGDACVKPDLPGSGGDIATMREVVLKLAPDEGVAREEWTFAMIVEEIQKHELFADHEIRNRKGDLEEMFDAEGHVTPAGRSFVGKFLTRFDQRLFNGAAPGEQLRFVVEGKGNGRKYWVVREGVGRGVLAAAVVV
jgi:hypothetical protein